MMIYIQYLWSLRPPLENNGTASLLSLQDMKENLKLALHGYGEGYLRTVFGYGLFAVFALNFMFLGKFVFRFIWKGEPLMSFPEKFASYYVVGSLGYSLIWLALGSLGFISIKIGIFLIIVGLLFMAFQMKAANPRTIINSSLNWFNSCSPDEKFLFAGLLLILASISTLSIMNQIYSDAYQIHLPLPWAYIQWGRISPNAYSIYSYFPQNTEMLMIWPLLFKSEVAAVLIQWGFLASIIFMVWGFFSRTTEKWIGLSAAYMALASTAIVWYGVTIKNDLPTAAFLLMHYVALINSLTSKDSDLQASSSWLLVSGIFCGGAIGHKLTAAIPAVWTLLLLTALDFKDKNIGKKSRALRWGIAALACSAPWFIKAFCETGNPVYPYFNSLFGGTLIKPWHTVAQISSSASVEGWPAVIKYFANIVGLSRQNGLILPAEWGVSALSILLIVPLMRKPLPSGIKLTISAAVLSYLSLLIYALEFRYQLGVFVLIVLFPFAYFAQAAKNSKLLKYAVYVLILGSIVQAFSNSLTYSSVKQSTIQLVSGYTPGNFNLTRTDPQIQDLRWMSHLINSRTQTSERVLFAGVTYGYGVDRKFYFGVDPDKQILQDLAEQSMSSGDLAAKLKNLGISHILFNSRFNDIYRSQSRPELNLRSEDAKKIENFIAQDTALRYTTPDGEMQWLTLRDGTAYPALELSESDILFSPSSIIEMLKMLWGQQEYDEAQRIAEKSINLPMHSSNKAIIYGILGNLISLKGDIAAGETLLLKGVKIAPDNVSALLNLALFYKYHNLHPEQIQALVKKIREMGGNNLLRNYPGLAI